MESWKFLLVLITIFLSNFGIFVKSLTCDPAFGQNTFNPQCIDASHPYCVQTQQNPQTLFQCSQCISNCDCLLDEFCSKAAGQVGSCVKFELNGQSCLPLTKSQLLDPTIDSSKKCAMLLGTDFLEINQEGVCVDETCRYCGVNGGGMTSCGPTDGMQEERTCVYPGTLVNSHYAAWADIYPYPSVVWFTIFFTFVVPIIISQVILLFMTLHRVKGNTYKLGESTNEEKRAKEEEEERRAKEEEKRPKEEQKRERKKTEPKPVGLASNSEGYQMDPNFAEKYSNWNKNRTSSPVEELFKENGQNSVELTTFNQNQNYAPETNQHDQSQFEPSQYNQNYASETNQYDQPEEIEQNQPETAEYDPELHEINQFLKEIEESNKQDTSKFEDVDS